MKTRDLMTLCLLALGLHGIVTNAATLYHKTSAIDYRRSQMAAYSWKYQAAVFHDGDWNVAKPQRR